MEGRKHTHTSTCPASAYLIFANILLAKPSQSKLEWAGIAKLRSKGHGTGVEWRTGAGSCNQSSTESPPLSLFEAWSHFPWTMRLYPFLSPCRFEYFAPLFVKGLIFLVSFMQFPLFHSLPSFLFSLHFHFLLFFPPNPLFSSCKKKQP